MMLTLQTFKEMIATAGEAIRAEENTSPSWTPPPAPAITDGHRNGLPGDGEGRWRRLQKLP